MGSRAPTTQGREALEPRKKQCSQHTQLDSDSGRSPPQGTGAEPGSIRSMQKASQCHLPRTEQQLEGLGQSVHMTGWQGPR